MACKSDPAEHYESWYKDAGRKFKHGKRAERIRPCFWPLTGGGGSYRGRLVFRHHGPARGSGEGAVGWHRLIF